MKNNSQFDLRGNKFADQANLSNRSFNITCPPDKQEKLTRKRCLIRVRYLTTSSKISHVNVSLHSWLTYSAKNQLSFFFSLSSRAAKKSSFLMGDTADQNQRPLLTDKDDDRENNNKDLTSRVWIESKKLWQIVGPAIFSRISSYTMNIITQAFAGHLGDVELAAISIANTVIVGFNFGLLVITITKVIINFLFITIIR